AQRDHGAAHPSHPRRRTRAPGGPPMTGREDFFSDAGRHARTDPPAPTVARARARFQPARVAAIVAVLAVTIGAGVVDRVAHRAVAPPPPALAVTAVPSAAVESSAWYCAGGTSAPGSTAATTIQLVNTTAAPVDGTLSAVSDTGTTKSEPVVVPARAQSVVVPGPLVGGKVVAATVELDGGGVLVTESVAGPLGWSEAPCSRSTAPEWYFASGSTVDGGTMAISLYNPTTTDAVVDMTFVTPSGISQPTPFEGIVVPPGTVAVEQVDSQVQDDASVSSIVVARTGAVVAAMLQTESVNGAHGVSLRLGAPTLSGHWTLPDSIDLTNGTTAITVFNPVGRPDRVTVTVHPGASPVATFTHLVGPRTAWVLETSGEGRIPAGVPFLATVRASGPGVVVDRSISAPRSFSAPQFGAVTGLSSGPPQPLSAVAVLPGPGTRAHPSTADAVVEGLSIVNPGAASVRASVLAMGVGGLVPLGSVTVRPGRAEVFGRSGPGAAALRRVGRVPLVVRAGAPVGVLEDLGPSAAAAVVGIAGAGSGPVG
ncbi:MAG: DUF5719 family protein, partial [Acidimicrobiales bacterium]